MSTKKDKFKKLGNFNPKTGKTRLVNVSEFIDEYKDLKLGNGGSWCRASAMKWCKFVKVKANGKFSLNWEPIYEEALFIKHELVMYQLMTKVRFTSKCNTITLLQIFGLSDDTSSSRPISDHIRKIITKQSCVVCGSNSEIIPDHKNDLYNDLRVLSKKTQKLSDFQPLCNHCNLQKRQVAKVTRETGKRYGATNIAQLLSFGVDFITCDETFDVKDPYAMVGTYWYNPVEFMENLFPTMIRAFKSKTI